ncbi:DUF4157 domain-containing protein [Aliifodinibius salicampi]|uniref:DUF4157 domain-containing protein n=1 Tax=Fodinibius salicampi TaxID=1920655 RepID=A0ABT3PZ21_9BACT|nr:DUF4157 domain-containing protein [Fodinibius salicampi]MCW9713099.1 DUF4157 domain-containing protein [Fodinibius salicampi]
MKTVDSQTTPESTNTSIPLRNGSEKSDFFSARSGSSIPFFGPSTVQPKLNIGQPGNKYEHQADRVADTVMRMPDSQIQRQPIEEEEEELQMKREETLIQRKCEECEEEEKLQKKSDGKSTSADRASNISSQLASKSGTGNRLPKTVRSEMAHKMGVDFSGVNIHTGPAAHKLNRQLGARAFTHGSDIYFNKGEYNPEFSEGKHLLAHELTHVVQQKGDGQNKIQRFVNCEEEEGCQERDTGEIPRSRSSEMMVAPISNPVEGLLVSHFTVGSSDLKENLENNSIWTNYWGQMITNENIQWQILGFSDCHGSDNVNTLIRWERAIAVNNALPSPARQKIVGFRAAPLDLCIAGNETEESRAYNRSALIQQVITGYDFDDGEEITACPTPQEWLRRALARAEITMSDWEPSEGFETNRETVMNVYAYYEYLYQTDSDLLWAGMAKLAGGTVFGAMEQAQSAQRMARAVPQVAPIADYYSNRLMELLLAMQKDIFLDLGWQHQAYIERGLECLESIMAGDNIPIEAWRDIASGESGRVSEGNQALLRREQEEILPPYYDEIQDIPDMDILPQAMSLLSQSPIPSGRSFDEVVEDGDITEFEDRWRWITEDMLPKYENLPEEYRSRLVDTPLEQLAERDFPSEP